MSVSILYCTAAPAAAPAGTTRLKALPASWAVATPNQRSVRRATRCRAHAHTKLAASAPSITTYHSGFSFRS